jgi:bis(5'-nucleosyl)-tetraphosphatase (symmetrical)
MKRTLLIGDIHGCYDELILLIEKLDYNPKTDRLILLGDLINKGPYPFKVLKFAKENNLEVIKGNHEQRFLKYVENKETGQKGLDQLIKKMGNDLDEWVEWIRSWPLFIEEDDFLAVHAGRLPRLHPRETPEHILTTIRTWDGKGDDLKSPYNPPWFDIYTDKKLVVFGHWAQRGLTKKSNAIGLDSGCVYGGHLSALTLPEEKIVQVKAKEVYQEIKKS